MNFTSPSGSGSYLIPQNDLSSTLNKSSSSDSFSHQPTRNSYPLSRSPRTTGHFTTHHLASKCTTQLQPNSQSTARSASGVPFNERVRLNVGGQHFMTYRSTLERVPGSRLAKLDELDPFYDLTTGEYFFDRNASLFSSILDLYRTGELHFSHCVCGPAIKKELQFWCISEETIADCCWRSYKTAEDEENTAQMIEKALTEEAPTPREGFKFGEWQHRVWCFVDRPLSSIPATVSLNS